jgi:uncharacterized membrane protein YeaQ/YmgE (transglycosylase-associated protein family)
MLYSIIIGAIAGLIAGKVMKGGGFGILLNIILGIVGGVVGSWLFGIIGISFSEGIIGDLIRGSIGAIAILFVAGLFNKK